MSSELDTLLSTVADALRMPVETVTIESDRDNLAAWDSLGHIQVVLGVEARFDVRFTTEQIPTLTSIRALAAAAGCSLG